MLCPPPADISPGYGVYGQRYDSTGQPVGSEFQINNNTYATQQGWWSFPSVASLEGGCL